MAAKKVSFGRFALLKQSVQVDCYSINLCPSPCIFFQGRLVIYLLSNRFVTCLQASVYNINAYIFIVSVFVNDLSSNRAVSFCKSKFKKIHR